MDKVIAFIGAGSITEALLRGILSTGAADPTRIRITNRTNEARRQQLSRTFGVACCVSIDQTVADADIIFLCMKPKDMAQSLAVIAASASPDALYISVAAGCSIAMMMNVIERAQATIGAQGSHNRRPRMIRAMPNTSCAVLESATAYALGPTCTEADAATAEQLLRVVGACYRMDEDKLDAVTGLSGSGPAYIYFLVEALTEAGIAVGLDQGVAKSLVTQTLIGAAAMLRQTDESPTLLRERVTSPGGTTMAGIAVLRERGFEQAIKAAVVSATERATELGAALI